MGECLIVRRGGAGSGGSSVYPNFTYTGTYTIIDEEDGNWKIKFLSSGSLTMLNDVDIDLFMVGGGGGGYVGGGGAGGYTATLRQIPLTAGVYVITIGAGATGGSETAPSAGGTTKLGDYSIGGGKWNGSQSAGGSGGAYSGKGASDGASTENGLGQGTTTREFGENTGVLYSGGGGGRGAYTVGGAGGAGGTTSATTGGGVPSSRDPAESGTLDGVTLGATGGYSKKDIYGDTRYGGCGGGGYGGGGGGTYGSTGGNGAQGIAIIRNAR